MSATFWQLGDGLPAELGRELERLRADGVQALRSESQEGRSTAYRAFVAALDLLPPPPEQWPQARALYCHLGDVYWQAGQLDVAMDAYVDAVRCRDGLGSSPVHLRLGKTALILGDPDRAADELCRAYLARAWEDGSDSGLAVFDGEDPAYFAFLQTRMQPPQGGW